MGAQLYVGNLDHHTTEDNLRQLLARDGRTVKSLQIKTDKSSGRSRGFAFAELGSEDEVQAAIASLNGTELDGRPLKINHGHARPIYSGTNRSQSDYGSGFRREGGGRR